LFRQFDRVTSADFQMAGVVNPQVMQKHIKKPPNQLVLGETGKGRIPIRETGRYFTTP
jgi:hypothetical protein